MNKTKRIETPLTDDTCENLRTGDVVLLSGHVFTGRDVAHRKLFEASVRGEKLPIDLRGETMFYAGPTPAMPGRVIGSIGPTTSSRMDQFTPRLLELGMKGMIGKGKRSSEVREAIKRHKAVYFGTMGGVAALLSQCVKRAEVVAYDELGPEAVMRLEIAEFPLVVVNDMEGNDLYERAIKIYRL